MSTVKDIYSFLDVVAPFSTSAPWDNTGLLVGDENKEVKKVMLSLDVTKEVIDEAINKIIKIPNNIYNPILFHSYFCFIFIFFYCVIIYKYIAHYRVCPSLEISPGCIFIHITQCL